MGFTDISTLLQERPQRSLHNLLLPLPQVPVSGQPRRIRHKPLSGWHQPHIRGTPPSVRQLRAARCRGIPGVRHGADHAAATRLHDERHAGKHARRARWPVLGEVLALEDRLCKAFSFSFTGARTPFFSLSGANLVRWDTHRPVVPEQIQETCPILNSRSVRKPAIRTDPRRMSRILILSTTSSHMLREGRVDFGWFSVFGVSYEGTYAFRSGLFGDGARC